MMPVISRWQDVTEVLVTEDEGGKQHLKSVDKQNNSAFPPPKFSLYHIVGTMPWELNLGP